MAQEPERQANEPAAVTKLMIDRPSDFQFYAAYLTYCNIYDKATNPETKKQLNQNITALQQNQIDYPAFYRNISQYRAEDTFQHGYSRAFVKTQRKREWRRKMQRHERIERHKK